jgi:hypothetical protein
MLPMILSTFAGFFAFVTNPASGERLGLGITVMLTNAAIYIVAFEIIPKGAAWTTITRLHIVSFCYALATLAISLASISLYCVQSSDASEGQLLNAFVAADVDGSGDIDKVELEALLLGIGLAPATKRRLVATLEKYGTSRISLAAWFDVVDEVYMHAELSSFHSWILGRALMPLIRRERLKRKASVLARIGSVLEQHVARMQRMDTTKTQNASPADRRLGGDDVHGSSGVAGGASDESYAACGFHFGEPDCGDDAVARARDAVADDAVDVGSNDLSQCAYLFEGRPAPSPADPARESMAAAITDSTLEDDVQDPTEYVARHVAGYIDKVAAVLLPLSYLIFILVLLRPGRTEGAWGRADFDGTEISHLRDGVANSW